MGVGGYAPCACPCAWSGTRTGTRDKVLGVGANVCDTEGAGTALGTDLGADKGGPIALAVAVVSTPETERSDAGEAMHDGISTPRSELVSLEAGA